MSKKEQIEMIVSIMKNLEADLMSKVDKIPDEWNGFEIKQWISDYYKSHFVQNKALNGIRLKNYNNDIRVKNLL